MYIYITKNTSWIDLKNIGYQTRFKWYLNIKTTFTYFVKSTVFVGF